MARKRLLWLALGVGCAVGVAIVFGLWRNRPEGVNVLLVTFDTTRSDRIGCYGYEIASTPSLDQLAEQGVLFERAFAPAPLTSPSHATMLTGLLPPEHGLRTNGRDRLDDKIPTLAEILSERGYRTAAFIAAFVLDSKFGMDRGFQTYDDDLTGTEETDHPMHRSRSGERVVDLALSWLDRNRDGPFFCWVHLYEPHDPHLDHPEIFGTRFADRPYDAEIAFADLQLGRLTRFLADRGLDRETLVVVAGDHGEGLGDHQEPTHGQMLYNTTMQVPLIVAQPGRFAGGRRERAVVSLADVFPTLVDCLDLPLPRTGTGRSLKPALLGRVLPSSVCYGETDEPYLEYGWAPLRSLTTEKWKYIRTTRVELYDLEHDPAETQNLAVAQPERVAELESQWQSFENRLTAHAAPAAQLSDQDRRTLASLGYVGGSSLAAKSPPPGESLPDVKDMIVHFSRLEKAQELMQRRDFQQAAEMLEEVVQAAPDYARAHGNLGICLAEMGRYQEAEEHYHRVLELGRDVAGALMNLGLVCRSQGKADEAVAHFEALLNTNPQDAAAHWHLATTLEDRGREEANLEKVQEAVAHYSAVVRLSPDDVQALVKLAWLLAAHERAEIRNGARAVRLAERACELTDYQFPYALDALAAAYAEAGRFSEAVRTAEKCLAVPGVDRDPRMVRAFKHRLTPVLGPAHRRPDQRRLRGGDHGRAEPARHYLHRDRRAAATRLRVLG